MNNKIFCSTGCVIAPDNLWSEELIVTDCTRIEADGFELMTVKPFYEKLMKVVSAVERSSLSFPVIHLEKQIAVYLASDDKNERDKGIELFKTGCALGRDIGALRAVFHLWSGKVSDTRIENNLLSLDTLYEIAEKHSLLLMIENVPCVKYDPISNFERVSEKRKNVHFVYDTRFGAFHRQNEKMLESEWLSGCDKSGSFIDHVHVSGYRGGDAGDFGTLRPILHLEEGAVDHALLLEKLFSVYDGTLTCESPAVTANGTDIDAINRDLSFIKKILKKIRENP